MSTYCQNYTPQTCWVIGEYNQIQANKAWLELHDLEQYSIGPQITYRGIPKIPPEDYPEIEKVYNIVFYDYYGVKYISIRKRFNTPGLPELLPVIKEPREILPRSKRFIR